MDANGKVNTARQLNALAAKMTERGDLPGARQHLDEASMVLGPLADSGDIDVLSTLATIHEGKGQIAMHVNRFDEAHFQLTQALAFHGRIQAAGGDARPLNVAICHMNLSTAASGQGQVDQALEANAGALTALEPLAEDETGRFMRLAALQARASLFGKTERHADTLAAYEDALAYGLTLRDGGFGDAATLLSQVRLGFGVTLHARGQHDRARTLTQEAADDAWTRFEELEDQEAIGQYLTAQMNLVAMAESLGDFADAEDALFRVLKLIGPEPRVLARGKAFYEGLLTADDAVLAAGNLPRDEVEDGLAEIVAMMADAPEA